MKSAFYASIVLCVTACRADTTTTPEQGPGATRPSTVEESPEVAAAGPTSRPVDEGSDPAPDEGTAAVTLDEFAVAVPRQWEKGEPRGPMRIAQWVLPGPGGDAELVAYRFKGGAGGIEANMTRWKGQFTPAEGTSIEDVATQQEKDVGDLTVHTLDITGHYTAAMLPGSAERHDEPNTRLLAAIVEGSGDPLFFKATGPAETLEKWHDAWGAMLASLETNNPAATDPTDPE